MVLSNEARKEMAKQARAAKDERRAMLDARHKYLIAKLVDSVSLGETEVEEAFISDDKVGGGWGVWSDIHKMHPNSNNTNCHKLCSSSI